VSLTLLVSSPRVAPGLMSWSAWSTVASADRRLASSSDAPLARAVSQAGHRVEVVPSPTAAQLLALASAGQAVWLADEEEADSLPSLLAGSPVVDVLHASYDVPGARLLDLVTVMDRLRTECPWDRQQTHRSLARYLLEETYETLEAVESGDAVHLQEELGDLLLQVCFHARVASETAPDQGGFDIDDVAGGIVDKLVRRHPHVFAGVDVADAAEVEQNWESLKAAEKLRGSVLDGIPVGLPALALADKTLGRAAQVGATVPEPSATGADGAVVLGDRLLGLVAEGRAAGVDPEQALRDAVRRLADLVRAAER
jgi:XTP/dITP diphosphohydrolase